ncbi:ATP-binding protein [Paraclostridium ghonii]|uniref:ATP-binding protein n=1 Tax=Paraclostridium ghonii TaxID=29358 RepID=UPI00202CC347|nr:ATP-binding protein [Paeniclostridium ghonii]MCM0164968.1 ATP-binding protein [Paeniclostridium ghonii]
MITSDKRIRIIVGHYGSGKSEFSMNYITKLRDLVDTKVAISDLDIVNVYFRTREKRDFLQSKNIMPIDSSIQATTLDLPAVSAQVTAPITDKSYDYVIDVGGDEVGARVLGRFSHLIEQDDYEMFCVVNANREQTQNANDVIKHIKSIEKTSNLKVTGLINNTHLVRETTIEDILKGQKIAKEVSELTNIPIRYVTCLESLIPQLPATLDGDIFPINLYMRECWM